MFQINSSFYLKPLNYRHFCSILSRTFFRARKSHLSTADYPLKYSSSTTTNTPKDISTVDVADITTKVLSKFSNAWGGNKGETFDSLSLKDYIFRLSNINPELVRRFWRFHALKPEDVLEILLGFECNRREKYEVELKKVESLWGIFNMASEQTATYEHLPQTCKIMASMLVRVGLYRDVEILLSRRECQGVLVDLEGVFSDLIEGYISEFELDRAIALYGRMRRLSLVPSMSTFRALVKYLVQLNETMLMYLVYEDMIKMHAIRTIKDTALHDDVILILCMDGKVQEARDLVRKFSSFRIKPSNSVVSAICRGYCKKKDYDDLLSFLAEIAIAPDALLGTKILYSFCQNFSVEQADVFLQKLERLGYCPDEITLGILISSSCREGNLKNALIYISDIFSRGAKPHIYTYNALLSGTFKKGMWMHAREIFLDMNDVGITPHISTFRILIAGFCQARKFDEVKSVVYEMANHGLIEFPSTENPINYAFTLVGLNPLEVKIKRDNDKGFSRTEFYDDLGNGLYLDTDMDEYEKKVAKVLDDATMLDFNTIIIEKCHSQDMKNPLSMVNDLVRWGQRMSPPVFSSLLSLLSRDSFSITTIDYLLDVMFISVYDLDQKTLNLLVQTYIKNGFTSRARALIVGMLRRHQIIEHGTCSTLLIDLCKKGSRRNFHYYFKIAQQSNWSPQINDCKALLGYLIHNKWLTEALELFVVMLSGKPDNLSGTFHLLFEKLSRHGLSTASYILMEEFSNKALLLDDIAYGYLMSGFCREKKFREAYEIFDSMLIRDLSPPLDASIELISHLCRTKNFDEAVKVKNMCLKDQTSALLPVNCALINGFCKLRRLDEAVKLFREVLSKGLPPNVEIYNRLIACNCDANNWNEVFELLGYMIKNNMCISASSYSSIVRLICRERNFFVALSLKDLIVQVTDVPEIVLYNILLFHISSMRNSSHLAKVIDALENKGHQFDAASYSFLVTGFLLCKDVSCSLHYLTTMIRQDLRPSNRALRKVIGFLCCDGQVDLALDLSREMESRGWIHGTVIQNKIVEALLSEGKVHEAVEFLDRMESKCLNPDNVSYDYLIKLLSRCGRLEKAVDLVNIMLKNGNCPESTSYDYIVQGFCSRQMLDIALDFHAEMLYRGLSPDIITWDALICSLSEHVHNRVAEAESLLKSMIQLGVTPSKRSFQSVIDKYRSVGNMFNNKTSEVLKLMQQSGYSPDFETHWSVISSLSNSFSSSSKKDSGSFLSNLLCGYGFAGRSKNKPNSKTG